ncbi:MAG TPA: hypothetical protein VIH35_00045 [Kiritimatiellia bacterium]|jgi:hypothetical protein
MKTAHCFLLSLLGSALLASGAVAAEPSQIVRVSIQTEPDAGSASFVNNLQQRRLDKFMYDTGLVSLRCDVEWKAPPGTWIVFEYRFPKSLESRGFRTRSEEGKGAGVSAFFLQVPRGTPGEQIAWRARVLRDDEVLTERKSTLWR